MKLVIDIPDDAYETLKIFGKGNVGYYHEVILDGKPLSTWNEGLIKKIETEMHWDMVDDWGNFTVLHDELVEIIEGYCGADKPTSGCSSCPHSGSIIDGHVDCPDAYTEQSQYCGLNNKENNNADSN